MSMALHPNPLDQALVTVRELQYLVELARLGNFHRAAEVCGVSQPTLSTQIRKLEEKLGIILVERSTRHAILTPVGIEIVQRAQEVLNGVQDIQDIATRNTEKAGGKLRLGVFPTLGPYLLPTLVPLIAGQFPGLQLQLIEEKSELLLERLQAGQLDAALLALPIYEPGLQVTPIFEEPFLLAVPQDHALANRDSVTTDELHGHQLMLLEDGHCLRDQALSLCHYWGAQETSGFRATSLETLRQMVAAGMGITLLPKLATSGPLAQSGNLRFIRFLDRPEPSRTIGMVWRRSSARAAILRQITRLADQAWRTASADTSSNKG